MELESPMQIFPCEYWEIFKNTYFEEHLQKAASVNRKIYNQVFWQIIMIQDKKCKNTCKHVTSLICSKK